MLAADKRRKSRSLFKAPHPPGRLISGKDLFVVFKPFRVIKAHAGRETSITEMNDFFSI